MYTLMSSAACQRSDVVEKGVMLEQRFEGRRWMGMVQPGDEGRTIVHINEFFVNEGSDGTGMVHFRIIVAALVADLCISSLSALIVSPWLRRL